jgi:hypothetical protein
MRACAPAQQPAFALGILVLLSGCDSARPPDTAPEKPAAGRLSEEVELPRVDVGGSLAFRLVGGDAVARGPSYAACLASDGQVTMGSAAATPLGTGEPCSRLIAQLGSVGLETLSQGSSHAQPSITEGGSASLVLGDFTQEVLQLLHDTLRELRLQHQ